MSEISPARPKSIVSHLPLQPNRSLRPDPSLPCYLSLSLSHRFSSLRRIHPSRSLLLRLCFSPSRSLLLHFLLRRLSRWTSAEGFEVLSSLLISSSSSALAAALPLSSISLALLLSILHRLLQLCLPSLRRIQLCVSAAASLSLDLCRGFRAVSAWHGLPHCSLPEVISLFQRTKPLPTDSKSISARPQNHSKMSSASSSIQNLEWAPKCPCGYGYMILKTSCTTQNPGQRFWKCPDLQGERGCGLLIWMDELATECTQGRSFEHVQNESREDEMRKLIQEMMEEIKNEIKLLRERVEAHKQHSNFSKIILMMFLVFVAYVWGSNVAT